MNMKRTSKVPFPPGSTNMVDAEWVEIKESKEPWSEYELADGTVVRVKTVASEIWRLKNIYDNEGNPMYFMKNAGLMDVKAPDTLKKKSH